MSDIKLIIISYNGAAVEGCINFAIKQGWMSRVAGVAGARFFVPTCSPRQKLANKINLFLKTIFMIEGAVADFKQRRTDSRWPSIC